MMKDIAFGLRCGALGLQCVAPGMQRRAPGMQGEAPRMQRIAFGLQGIVTVSQTERQEGRLKSGGCYFLWREERSDGKNIRINRTIGE